MPPFLTASLLTLRMADELTIPHPNHIRAGNDRHVRRRVLRLVASSGYLYLVLVLGYYPAACFRLSQPAFIKTLLAVVVRLCVLPVYNDMLAELNLLRHGLSLN